MAASGAAVDVFQSDDVVLFDIGTGLHFDAGLLARPGFMGERLVDMTLAFAAVMGPIAALMVIVGIASNLASGGWNWTMKPLAPKFGHMNPLSGLGRLFSGQGLGTALKAVLLALVLGIVGALVLKDRLAAYVSIMSVPLPSALAYAGQQLMGGLTLLAIALAVFAAIDVPLQRQLWMRRMRMTREEAKQELKEVEGNVEVKAKLRARIRELNQRLLAEEKHFIGSLNAAAHLTERILQMSLWVATVVMAATYALIAHNTLKRRERDAQAMQLAQERWELAVAAAGLGRFDLDVEHDRYTLDARAAELNLFGWSEYIPQAVLDGFAQETGLKVNFETYGSKEELLSKLVAGGGRYDLVQPSDYAAEVMKRGAEGAEMYERNQTQTRTAQAVAQALAFAQREGRGRPARVLAITDGYSTEPLTGLDAATDEQLAGGLVSLDREPRRALLLTYLGFPYFDTATLPLLQGEGLDEFDPIKVDRIAPDDAVAIRSGGAEATLKGIQFNSFGAFFSRAYRENDYLWGRLHGAERMIDICVSTLPATVRMKAGRVAAIKRAAFRAILDEEEPRLSAIPALFASLRVEIG